MQTLLRNIRREIKLLWTHRAFAGAVVLTLAICIGANTAIFAIVNSVLLRPLPVPESDRIMFISNQYPKAGVPETFSVGIPDYLDRRQQLTVFEEEAMFHSEAQTVDIGGVPERITSMRVTPSLFRLLRTPPTIGRAFTDTEGEPGNEHKAILSDGLWKQLYGGNPSVVGQTMRVSGRPFTIVGVMPRGFTFLDPEVRFWTSFAFTDQDKSDDSRHSNNSSEIGRLKPGATIQQAQAQVDAVNAANLERFPKTKQVLINAGFHTQVRKLQDVVVRDIRETLYLLWGGAALVLLIGGVNIGNLVLARSSMRRKELATRLALGAGRIQVAGHLLTESILLGLVGGVVGLAIGAAALRVMAMVGLDQIPRAAEIHLDATVASVALAVSIGVGVIAGLVPIVHLSRINLSTTLREESRTGTGGRTSRTIRQVLVVAQVGLACVLLIGAGLLLASFRKLLAVDPGFKAAGVITISTAAPETNDPSAANPRRFMNRTLEAIRAIPGIEAAGATTSIPFGGSFDKNVIMAEGYASKPGESLIAPMQVNVSPGYFEAMGTRLKRGRFFNEHDTDMSPLAAIVDERLGHKFWGDRDPIGRRLYEPDDADPTKTNEKTKFWIVVGVVEDVRLADLSGEEQPLGAFYFSLDQSPSRRFTLAVKSTVDQAALAKTLRNEMIQVDRDAPLFDIRTMDERTRLSLLSRRAALALSLAFGGIALFLAAVGIYSVLTYLVAQRTREIGIRIALGSSTADVFKLVLREGIVLVLSGLVLGLAGAAGLRSFLESQIYGVQPMDPFVLTAVALSLAIIAFTACALPARAATRVDPVQVLNG